MEESILISTKKILGLDETYTTFDLDILTHINSSFTILTQMGVGPSVGFSIEDETTDWDEFISPGPTLSAVRSYVFLKTRLLFDPPTTSYLLDAMKEQIQEFEWRLCALGEAS